MVLSKEEDLLDELAEFMLRPNWVWSIEFGLGQLDESSCFQAMV